MKRKTITVQIEFPDYGEPTSRRVSVPAEIPALYLLHRLHANNYAPVYEPGVAERDYARLKNLISSMKEPI